MRTVFLDTVGLLAVWDESDQWHPAAQAAFVQLETQRASLITTPLVLAETANAAARRPYRAAVVRLREQVESAGWVTFRQTMIAPQLGRRTPGVKQQAQVSWTTCPLL